MYAEDALFWINHLQLIELKKEYTKTGLLLSSSMHYWTENIWALSLLLQQKADACGCYKNLVPVRNQNYKIVIQTILATVHHLSPLNVSLLLNLGAFFLLPWHSSNGLEIWLGQVSGRNSFLKTFSKNTVPVYRLTRSTGFQHHLLGFISSHINYLRLLSNKLQTLRINWMVQGKKIHPNLPPTVLCFLATLHKPVKPQLTIYTTLSISEQTIQWITSIPSQSPET